MRAVPGPAHVRREILKAALGVNAAGTGFLALREDRVGRIVLQRVEQRDAVVEMSHRKGVSRRTKDVRKEICIVWKDGAWNEWNGERGSCQGQYDDAEEKRKSCLLAGTKQDHTFA